MGYMIPVWAVWLRFFLFPLDSFYWKMAEHAGYQIRENTWIINGIKYHTSFFQYMENANGHTVKIWRDKDRIIIETIDWNE